MAPHLSRREFNKLLLSGLAGAGLAVGGLAVPAFGATRRVVVIGGGFGGAAAAKYLRKIDPSIAVTLVEPKKKYQTCPFSNWVIGGLKSMKEITVDYDHLKKRWGVEIVRESVTAIDGITHKVTLSNGKVLGYDRLVVSPGIDFRWESVAGYSSEVADRSMPHGYQAGRQTELLADQLRAMKDGGKVIICPPAGDFRCPAAPYERASLMAHYLKEHKPASKIVILDAKDGFSKQDLFMRGWERFYPGMIEWRSASGGGRVESLDPSAMTVMTDFGEEKGDVVNVIPAQKAGRIAVEAGLADASGWCPVDPVTFESRIIPGIHVIGDSCKADPMPKSGFAASSQGKVAAAAIARLFRGAVPAAPSLVSTCYSLITPGYAISVAGVYRLTAEGIVSIKGSGGLTPMNGDDDLYSQEANFARGWYNNMMQDTWG